MGERRNLRPEERANSTLAASGALKQPRLAITPCAVAEQPSAAAPDADEAAADTAARAADAEPVADCEWSPPADPRQPPARRDEAVYFRLVEGATADEYLEALLEFVPAPRIRFAGVERAPDRFAAYLDSERTVAEFARRHGYVRVRRQRLGAYTARQPPFRLVLSNVRPVIPNAALESALAGELELRLCSPIEFLRADCANPALRRLRGFRRSAICCAASAGDDEGAARVGLVPPSMAVEYDGERFHVELSAEELREGSDAPKPPTRETAQQPAVTGDGRTAAVKRRTPSSASDDMVILSSSCSDNEQVRKSDRVRKSKRRS